MSERSELLLAALPPADDRIYGPAPFSAWWLLAGTAALVVALAAAVLAVRAGRARTAPSSSNDDVARCLAALEELERRLASGDVDSREIHHTLSRTLRTFIAITGTPGAPAMSVDDLDAAGHDDVAATVRSFEPGQFRRIPDGDPRRALAAARSVITTTHRARESDGPPEPLDAAAGASRRDTPGAAA